MAIRARNLQCVLLAAFVLGGLAACNSILGTEAATQSEEDAGTTDDAGPSDEVDGSDEDDPPTDCPSGDLSQNADHCGRCGHSCLGGVCKKGQCGPVVLAADRITPGDLALAGAYVYVAELGTSSAHYADGRITRVKADCEKNCTTSKLATIEGAAALTLDSSTSVFYVAQWERGLGIQGSIFKVPLTGGEPTLFKAALTKPRTIALSPNSVFWINGGQAAFEGSVYGAFKDDSESGDAGMPLVRDLNYPHDIVVTNTWMYFTIAGELDIEGEVHRADLQGKNDVILAKMQERPRGIAFDGTYVYWVNFGDGTVHRVNGSGGKDEEIMTGCNQPVSIAVDVEGDRVYVVEQGTDPDRLDGRLTSVTLAGKNKLVLASNLQYPRGVRFDDDAVYFLERGTAEKGYRDGTLQRVVKP